MYCHKKSKPSSMVKEATYILYKMVQIVIYQISLFLRRNTGISNDANSVTPYLLHIERQYLCFQWWSNFPMLFGPLVSNDNAKILICVCRRTICKRPGCGLIFFMECAPTKCSSQTCIGNFGCPGREDAKVVLMWNNKHTLATCWRLWALWNIWRNMRESKHGYSVLVQGAAAAAASVLQWSIIAPPPPSPPPGNH